MKLPMNHFVLVLLLGWFTAVGGHAQELSIHQNSAREVSIDVPSLAGKGYAIERTIDWSEWTVFTDRFAGAHSHAIQLQEENMGFFRLRTWSIPETPITLVIIGDSTATDYATAGGRYSGWGQGMPPYFGSNLQIFNFASPGETTATFLAGSNSEARFNLEALQPEFVLVQFGFLDKHSNQEENQTTLEEFGANLQAIVELVREYGGTPVLVTPVTRRFFGEDGKIVSFLPDRCTVIKNKASELGTHLIDLNQTSEDLYNELGKEGSAYISSSETDLHHFSLEGAEIMAGLVVEDLPGFLQPYRAETQQSHKPLNVKP